MSDDRGSPAEDAGTLAIGRDPEPATSLGDLLDGAGVIVWEADAGTGVYWFISPHAEQMLGYPAERWLSDTGFWATIVHPDDRPDVQARRLACLRDGRPAEMEYRVIAEDGRTVWFRATSRVVRDGEGPPRAARGYMWEITGRKKVERQLHTDRARLSDRLADVSYLYELEGQLRAKTDLESTLEAVLAAVASLLGADLGTIRLFDRGHGMLEAVVSLGLSKAYLESFGRVPVGVGACGLAVERGAPVIIADVETDPAAGSWAEAARAGGYRASFSVPLISRGGGIMGAVATCFREPHRPSPRQVQLVERYVVRAAEAIDNARRHLAPSESDRRKEDVLATLAHELRNPLAAIRDWAQLLEPGRDEPETILEARAVIVRQAGMMSRLVDELLDAARIGRGAIALEAERVDLTALAARTAADLRPLFASRGRQLDVALPEGAAWLEADPTRLGQVLTNLLTNAARYTDPGGRIDLIVAQDREAGEVVLRVRDTGIGLAPEARTQIFELFARADPARDRVRGGLGIGLSLVKNLVELHSGTVSADSPGPGRGSEFVVRLPAEGSSRAKPIPTRPTAVGRAELPPEVAASPAERRLARGSQIDAA